MKLFFIAASILLVFYSFLSLKVLSPNRHVAVLWRHGASRVVVQIFPHDVAVLIDDRGAYVYLEESTDTYVSALRIDRESKSVRRILNYKYLIAWNRELPQIASYPPELNGVFDILDHLA